MRISKKYAPIVEAYLYFSKGFESADFSEQAKLDFYLYESTGTPRIKYSELQSNGMYNGYAIGKHMMDVTLSMWREDILCGNLIKFEIYSDNEIPDFIKSIVSDFMVQI